MFYNVTILKGKVTVNELPLTRAEAKELAENYMGAKVVKHSGPYHNGKPIIIEEERQLGWTSVTYLTGGFGLVPTREIEYK